MLTKLESTLSVFNGNVKVRELELDFLSIFKNFYESKVRQTQLDEDIDQLFANYGNDYELKFYSIIIINQITFNSNFY